MNLALPTAANATRCFGRHVDRMLDAFQILIRNSAFGKRLTLRSINKSGIVWGNGLTEKVVWNVVKTFAITAGIEKVAPHDLRRTCARLCHVAGGELEQIQFLLGHVSVPTTERYLGCKQKIKNAVNDQIGIGP